MDEADVLLDFNDQPEIGMILDGMGEIGNSFQLILASATYSDRLGEVMEDIMDLTVEGEGYVRIEDDGESARSEARGGGRGGGRASTSTASTETPPPTTELRRSDTGTRRPNRPPARPWPTITYPPYRPVSRYASYRPRQRPRRYRRIYRSASLTPRPRHRRTLEYVSFTAT